MNIDKLSSRSVTCASIRHKEKSNNLMNEIRSMEERIFGDALFSCPSDLRDIHPTKKNQTYSFGFRNNYFSTTENLTSMRSFPDEKDVDKLSNITSSDDALFNSKGKDINYHDMHLINPRLSDVNNNYSVLTHDETDINNWQSRYPFDERKNEFSLANYQSTSNRMSMDVSKHTLKNNFTISDLSYLTNPIKKSDQDLRLSQPTAGNGDSVRYKQKFIPKDNIKATETTSKRQFTKEDTNLDAITEKSDNIDSGIHPSSSSLDSNTFSRSSLSTRKNEISKCNIVSENSSIIRNVDSDLQLKPNPEENNYYNDICLSSRFNTFVQITADKTQSNLKNESRRISKSSPKVKASKIFKGSILRSKRPMKKNFISRNGTTSNLLPTKLSSMKLEVNNSTCEIINQDDPREQILQDDDTNVCNILTNIHEQLTYNSKRTRNIRENFQSTIAIDSSAAAAQLLGKVIARCKSCIHNSENSDNAVLKINELLSNCALSLQQAVNEEEAALEENETQHKHPQSRIYKKENEYRIPDRTRNTSTTDSVTAIPSKQRSRVVGLIKCMSSLLKVIIAESDEKENIKFPLKSLPNNQPTRSRPDHSIRNKTSRSKSARLNPINNGSCIDTQIGILAYLNNATKGTKSIECNFKSEDVEKDIGNIKNNTADKKSSGNTNKNARRSTRKVLSSTEERCKKSTPAIASNATDLNQTKQTIVRQKSHAPNNVQPVWRPAGVVRNPLSSSITSLVQKCCPTKSTCSKERARADNAKTRKVADFPKKPVTDSKDKPSGPSENRRLKMCTCLANVKLQQKMKAGCNKEHPDLSDERSDLNLKASSKSQHVPRAMSANNETADSTTNSRILKSYESTTSWESIPTRPEVEKKSRIIHILKDTIKSLSAEDHKRKNDLKAKSLSKMYCESHIPAESYNDLKSRIKYEISKSIDEKKSDSYEEEPTRDTDSTGFTKSQHAFKEPLQDNDTLQNVETLIKHICPRSQTLSQDLAWISAINPGRVPMDSGINVNFDNDRPPNFHCSAVSLANVSCTAEFSSTSNSTTRIPSTKCCQTSLNSTSSLSPSSRRSYQKDIADEKCNESISKTLSSCSVKGQGTCNNAKSESTEEFRKDRRTKKGFVNTHTLSLNKLKEFLCRQGVDPNLVNKAERDLNEKHRVRSKSVKRKSKTFATEMPVTMNVERVTPSSPCNTITNHNRAKIIVQSDEKVKYTSKIVKACETHIDDCHENLDLSIKGPNFSAKSYEHKSQKVDHALYALKNSHDVFSQTDFQRGKSESSQTTPERKMSMLLMQKHTVETQTEKRFSINRGVGTECCKEYCNKYAMTKNSDGRNVSLMTDAIIKSVNEVCTETVKLPCISKSVMTTCTESLYAQELFEQKEIAIITLDEQNNKTSMERHSEVTIELLEDPCDVEDCKSSPNYVKRNESRELRFIAPTIFDSSSSATSLSSECTEVNQVSTRNIPNDVLTALQALVRLIIRTREIYEAINICRSYLKTNIRKMLKEQPSKRFLRINAWNNQECPKTLARSNGNTVINDHKVFNQNYDNMFVSLNSEIKNISLYFDVDSDVSHQELPSEFLDIRPTRNSICFIKSGSIVEDNGNEEFRERTAKRLPDVLPEVESLVNFLLFHTEDKTIDVINFVQEVSLEDERSFYSVCCSGRNQGREYAPTFAILSRKNLLPLMYGVLSSIVFWCLQFSVTCDSGLPLESL